MLRALTLIVGIFLHNPLASAFELNGYRSGMSLEEAIKVSGQPVTALTVNGVTNYSSGLYGFTLCKGYLYGISKRMDRLQFFQTLKKWYSDFGVPKEEIASTEVTQGIDFYWNDSDTVKHAVFFSAYLSSETYYGIDMKPLQSCPNS